MTIWDATLRRQLHRGESRFDIDVRFTGSAARVVLYGPSGAGKTQTLRMMAGISRPDAGRVVVADRVLFDSASGIDLPPRQRQLAFMFQDYALFPHLTVRQNIAFALGPGWRNPARSAQHEDVERWIQRFRMQEIAGHLPHQISGGQRQRTALARALITRPAALLLDEPFAALDKWLRRQLRDELLELQQTLNLPMLLITHDDDDVAALAQQVVHLADGRVVEKPPAPAPEPYRGAPNTSSMDRTSPGSVAT